MFSDILDYADTYITDVNNRFRNNGNTDIFSDAF